MDTKDANIMPPQEAALEETLAETAVSAADIVSPETLPESDETQKVKSKRSPRAKKKPENASTDDNAVPEVEPDTPEEPADDSHPTIKATKTRKLPLEDAVVPCTPNDSTPDEPVISHAVLGSKKEIIDALKALMENTESDQKDKIDCLKQAFYKIHKQDVDHARKAFVEGGKPAGDFIPEEDPLESEFKALLNGWREKRAEKQLEEDNLRKSNLEKKLQIIEEIKALAESTEDIGKNFPDFRRLQQSWKEIGNVPQDQVNELWKNYQIQIERFYDLLKINNEFREYDFRKNLEAKTVMCESAEKLAEEPDIVTAFRQLQKLHDEWRETGPVAKELREELWNRFKVASAVINKKHQQFFEQLKTIENENLSKKTALCETLEAIDFNRLKTYKDWDEQTSTIIQMQEQWKSIGFAPKKVNIKIFERFRAACDHFFRLKSEFYKASKDTLAQNLEKKKALCEKAESLKESTDWKTTSDLFIQIQKEWKTIGPVPKKLSDAIWKRFIGTCDYFFEQKEKNAPSQKNEEQRNLAIKKDLIDEMNNISEAIPEEEAIKQVHELTARWNETGHVPFKEKDNIYKWWHESLDKQMARLRMDKNSRRLSSFQQNLEDMGGKNHGKVLYERERLVRQFENLTNEIKTSENNIGFFTTSKSSGNGLLDQMKRKIETLKNERELIYKKIQMIDEQL